MEFSGHLASFPIAELLSWAHNDQRTGALVVRRSSAMKKIFLQEGHIVACHTDSPADYYGKHLLLDGTLDRKALFRCLTQSQRDQTHLGRVLQERGVLDADAVRRTLRQHVEDIVCDLFLWHQGIFFFHSVEPPQDEVLAEPIDPLVLVLEGSRWVDEMRRFRDIFPHDNMILRRLSQGVRGKSAKAAGKETDGEGLSRRQRIILRELESPKTLEALYEKVDGSYYRFLEAVVDLDTARKVEVADVGENSEDGTYELSIYDFLLEQAAEQQGTSLRHEVAVPLDALEHFVPVWLRPPEEEEWERLPREAQEFYSQFDGTSRLAAILSQDPHRRSRETEFLAYQLRRQNVALLPASEEEAPAVEAPREIVKGEPVS